MFEMPILKTERLALVPARETDLPWFLRVWSDPQVRRHLWQGRAVEFDEAVRTLDTCIRHGGSTGLGMWRAVRPDGKAVGFFGFWPRADVRRPDVFMGLLPGFWKQGYGLEAAMAVFRHAFEQDLADEICCSVAAENFASQSLVERAGMEFVCETGIPGARTLFYRLTPGLLMVAEQARESALIQAPR